MESSCCPLPRAALTNHAYAAPVHPSTGRLPAPGEPLGTNLFYWLITPVLVCFLFWFNSVAISGVKQTLQALWELSPGMLSLAIYYLIGFGLPERPHWLSGRKQDRPAALRVLNVIRGSDLSETAFNEQFGEIADACSAKAPTVSKFSTKRRMNAWSVNANNLASVCHRFPRFTEASSLRLMIWICISFAVPALEADVSPLPKTEASQLWETGISARESPPEWPKPVRPPAGAPNIVIILLDDIGFGDAGTFGGLAQTPELDRLAAQGLRYNNFHTTAMCSPTRAALLTGHNHHRVGIGIIPELAAGYPGYNSVWKESTASIAEILRRHGYSTAAFGKWHNTPLWEINSSGPFDRWPTGRGFEYFYGFMNAEDNQWEPSILYRNTLPVDPPATPEQGYHLTADITNSAIQWVAQHKARSGEKPYFLYFATGAVHHPHHAPREWIDRYRGTFDQGWDWLNAEVLRRQKQLGVVPENAQLTPRPKEIPAWATLSAAQKKIYARQMEVYAGFIAHTDYEIGRLLKEIRTGPEGDNTIVVFIVGDNGAADAGLDGWAAGARTLEDQLELIDQLGGPEIPENSYSRGWAWAGNTPFQYWKTIASHLGGVRNPMVVAWPAKIKNVGEVRSQFTHVTDVAPTLYDVIGLPAPARVNGVEQQPLDGVSFAQTFSDSTIPSAHRTQYFELLSNRAIYHDGWIAAARHVEPGPDDVTGYSKDRWELYHLSDDFSQARDLAMDRPDKLRELLALFDREAKNNDVYPMGTRVPNVSGMPSLTEGRMEFVYFPWEQRIPPFGVPQFAKSSSYRVSADVRIPETGGEGVLLSCGDRSDGFVWYVKEDRVIYESKVAGDLVRIYSKSPLPRGKVKLTYEFIRDGTAAPSDYGWGNVAGTGRLYINEELVGEERLPLFRLWRDVSLYIGRAAGSPVSDDYTQPFSFTGTMERVTVILQ